MGPPVLLGVGVFESPGPPGPLGLQEQWVPPLPLGAPGHPGSPGAQGVSQSPGPPRPQGTQGQWVSLEPLRIPGAQVVYESPGSPVPKGQRVFPVHLVVAGLPGPAGLPGAQGTGTRAPRNPLGVVGAPVPLGAPGASGDLCYHTPGDSRVPRGNLRPRGPLPYVTLLLLRHTMCTIRECFTM